MAETFDEIKNKLINRIKSNFPDTYSDFHEASTGMMIADLQSFTLHALEEYVDNIQSEKYFDTVKDTAHALAILKGNNVKNINLTSSARGYQQFTITVPKKGGSGPDADDIDGELIPTLKAGTVVVSISGNKFQLLQDLNFAQGRLSTSKNLKSSEREIRKLSNGDFLIRKTGLVTSEEIRTSEQTIPSTFESFREITINDDKVTSIVSVVDSDGNNWYEVDHLSQEFIFKLVENVSDDKKVVPYILTTIPVPRRFVKDFDVFTKKTKLVFGGGRSLQQDQFVVPDLELITRQLAANVTPVDFGDINPEIFINTPTLGLSPYNTTLTINYRIAKGSSSNVYTVNSITSFDDIVYSFRSGLDEDLKSQVISTIETYNSDPITGGEDNIDLNKLLSISPKYYFSQDRCVTIEDYLSHIYNMPSSLGRVFRAGIYSSRTTNETNIIILSSDKDGKLTESTSSLKRNIKTYLDSKKNKNDNIVLSDAEIINLSVKYSIVADNDAVLTTCNKKILENLDVRNRDIGQSIAISKIIKDIQSVEGVVSVAEIKFESNDIYVNSLIKNGIIMCPKNSMFQIKDPLVDIIGIIL